MAALNPGTMALCPSSPRCDEGDEDCGWAVDEYDETDDEVYVIHTDARYFAVSPDENEGSESEDEEEEEEDEGRQARGEKHIFIYRKSFSE